MISYIKKNKDEDGGAAVANPLLIAPCTLVSLPQAINSPWGRNGHARDELAEIPMAGRGGSRFEALSENLKAI